MKKQALILLAFSAWISVSYAQKLTVKDSDTHVLMEVNDEGDVGSISLPSGSAPGTLAGKLYNVGGTLYWSGYALGTAGNAGGWTDGGANVYLSTKGDNVGIGTPSPGAKLDIRGTLNVGVDDTGYDVNFFGTEAGSRLFWDESKMAFRAGIATGTEWDDANVGPRSVAMGYNTIASVTSSTAMGVGTIACGYASTAMGCNTRAFGEYSTAMGVNTIANDGYYSTAMGYWTTAYGQSSTAMGSNTTAGGESSTAMGGYTTASGNYSTAMGVHTTASGNYSTAMGDNTTAYGPSSTAMGSEATASGSFSTAMGRVTKAEAYASTALGRYNVGSGTADSWVSTDPIFEIGIGEGDGSRDNAVTVLKNGKVGIGNSSPGYLLTMKASGGGYYNESTDQWVNGSARAIKQDIRSNAVNVQEILDGVDIMNFRYKNEVSENPDAPYHIGFIAEDTPELLSGRNRDGMATGDCIGLLLAAVKEQQKRIQALEERIRELESR